MRQFNPFKDFYPPPKEPRLVGKGLRSIQNRLIALARDKEFYDGDRNNGYGGFRYDSRWQPIVKKLYTDYGLSRDSKVLQLQSEKGFLLNDFKENFPDIEVMGVESSDYAIEETMPLVKPNIIKSNFLNLPLSNKSFDLVIALGVVYAFGLKDSVQCLKEIERVCRGSSLINLASYETEEEYFLFKDWSLLGVTMLQEEEWLEVMKFSGYTGDYFFTGAKQLNLLRKS